MSQPAATTTLIKGEVVVSLILAQRATLRRTPLQRLPAQRQAIGRVIWWGG